MDIQKPSYEDLENRVKELELIIELSCGDQLLAYQQTKEQLLEEHKLNIMLLNTLPHPAMIITKDRKVLAANKVAQEAGVSVGTFCWQEFGKCLFIPDENLKEFEETGEILPNTFCSFCKGNECLINKNMQNDSEVHAFDRIFDTYWIAIDDEKYLHYAIDVTENIEREKELQAYNDKLKVTTEALEQSEKLKSAFLANMSHEIRTPMNSILGFSQLLKRTNLSKQKKEKYLEIIDTNGKRLMAIISDIVDISKIDAHQFSINSSDCNLNDFFDDLFSQSKLLSKKKDVLLKVNKGLKDEHCCVKTDSVRLMQVFGNLIENAQKFTHSGEIEIGYQLAEDDSDAYVQYYVRDTGIGIAPKDQKIIFERFRQVNNEYSFSGFGTGLGLSIVKGIIDLFGGEIWLESEVENLSTAKAGGTTFYFKLPYFPGKKPAKAVEEKDISDENFGKQITILIAEDEISNFMFLEELLDGTEYKVIRAKNGQEAVEEVQDNPAIDLVLMDVKMPIMGGYEATIEIRKTNKKIPIIAQTAYAMTEDEREAEKAGCSGYLSKPISQEKLRNMIKKLLP